MRGQPGEQSEPVGRRSLAIATPVPVEVIAHGNQVDGGRQPAVVPEEAVPFQDREKPLEGSLRLPDGEPTDAWPAIRPRGRPLRGGIVRCSLERGFDPGNRHEET